MFQEGILFTTVINHQNKATMVFFESLRCLKVCFTQSPQWSRHYVGVPMFWQVWQYQKMRQHQNRFQTSGSSPSGSRAGSLYKVNEICIFEFRFKVLG